MLLSGCGKFCRKCEVIVSRPQGRTWYCSVEEWAVLISSPSQMSYSTSILSHQVLRTDLSRLCSSVVPPSPVPVTPSFALTQLICPF